MKKKRERKKESGVTRGNKSTRPLAGLEFLVASLQIFASLVPPIPEEEYTQARSVSREIQRTSYETSS